MPSTSWRVGNEDLDLTDGLLMGVINVTPDSFSDGGDHLDPMSAVAAGLRMSDEGAAVIDVGGESTRPRAKAVGAEEEMGRVLPVVEALAGRGVRVSIDTSKPSVARAATAAGATVINDVTGFVDPEMISAAVESGASVVIMHMKGSPRTMQENPTYDDVVDEVSRFLSDRSDALVAAGVESETITVDPGIGFGKTVTHNLDLVSRLGEIVELGYPVVLGMSRKSTLKELTGEQDPKRRDGHTAVTTALGFERGARVFRVHDVAASRDALRIAAAIVEPRRWEEWQQD